jgi:hypothetical protein
MCQVPSEELGRRCPHPTQVSMLQSLGYGALMGISGDQDRRHSQLAHLTVASVVKSFSWDPSFTLAETWDIVCPP